MGFHAVISPGAHNNRDDVSNLQHFSWWLQRRSKKYLSSASLTFVQEIQQWQVNSPQKRPVTRQIFPFDDVIMFESSWRRTFMRGWLLMDFCRTLRINYDWPNARKWRELFVVAWLIFAQCLFHLIRPLCDTQILIPREKTFVGMGYKIAYCRICLYFHAGYSFAQRDIFFLKRCNGFIKLIRLRASHARTFP